MSSQTIKLDIYNNGELLNPVEDKRLLGQLQIKDRTVCSFHTLKEL